MILFNKKEPDVQNCDSLKDFAPEAMENFLVHRGRDLYTSCILRTVPAGFKFYKGKWGKFNPSEVSKIFKDTKINHPASLKDYQGKDYLEVSQKMPPKLDPKFDLPVYVDTGVLIFPEYKNWNLLAFTLTKYHKPNSDWEYKFIAVDNNYPKPIITCPKSKIGWEELGKALLEFCVTCKLFGGVIMKIFMASGKSEETKYFSSITSYLPTAASLIYRTLVYPILASRLWKGVGESIKYQYSPKLLERLKEKIKKEYSDKLIVSDLGNKSYFLNLTEGEKGKELARMMTDPKFLEANQIDPDRRRCELDWWAYAASGKDNSGKPRDLIVIADIDPVAAVFHEFGHFLENHEEKLGRIQRASNNLQFSKPFAGFISFILGFTGPIGEILGWLSAFALRMPTLITEWKASYYGLQVMKELGASEEDIENAKKFLKKAYQSYLLGTSKSAYKSALGRLGGIGIKHVIHRK